MKGNEMSAEAYFLRAKDVTTPITATLSDDFLHARGQCIL